MSDPNVPTLIIPPPSTLPATTDPQYTPSFSGDEIDFLETVLKYFQMNYSGWNATPPEEERFNTVLAKIQNLQINPPEVIQQLVSAAVQTPAIDPHNIESVQILWTNPFADNNYVVTGSIEDDSGFLRFNGFSYLDSGTGILARVQNTDSAASHQGVLNALAFYLR